ncbi:hypothetical protein C2845_PM02G03380 [Panicum miliaceum]|uniref:Pectinesterase inhibitor domain-containing protein n=1 Tax=Panicum miliaceum TaxID=4540 RepID=A0A3L6SDT9_PANMI|nr:hypothetical protein C2845_PM02G03380 [Panicum miliaceum]
MIGTPGGRCRAGRRGHGRGGGEAGVPPRAGRGREGSVVRELRELVRSPSMELLGRERRRRGCSPWAAELRAAEQLRRSEKQRFGLGEARGLRSRGEVEGRKGGEGRGGVRARLPRGPARGLRPLQPRVPRAGLRQPQARGPWLAGRGIPPPSSGALSDCAEAIASAADQAARAAERLRGVKQAVGLEVLWHVDDALTWLNVAMTDEDTCAGNPRWRR